MKRASILAVFPILFTVSLASADLPFADDFNRPDSIFIGNGWGTWGGNVRLEGNRIYAGGGVGGAGLVRDDLPFPSGVPMTFDFDFDVVSDNPGGWVLQVNTTNPDLGSFDNHPRLLALMQHEGEEGVRLRVGENLYGSWQYSSDARPWVPGDTTHISGIIFPDLAIQVTVDYLDGGPPAVYDFDSGGIDPTTIEQGNLFALGEGSRGGSYFDNLVVTPEPSTAILLGLASVLALRRRRIG